MLKKGYTKTYLLYLEKLQRNFKDEKWNPFSLYESFKKIKILYSEAYLGGFQGFSRLQRMLSPSSPLGQIPENARDCIITVKTRKLKNRKTTLKLYWSVFDFGNKAKSFISKLLTNLLVKWNGSVYTAQLLYQCQSLSLKVDFLFQSFLIITVYIRTPL